MSARKLRRRVSPRRSPGSSPNRALRTRWMSSMLTTSAPLVQRSGWQTTSQGTCHAVGHSLVIRFVIVAKEFTEPVQRYRSTGPSKFRKSAAQGPKYRSTGPSKFRKSAEQGPNTQVPDRVKTKTQELHECHLLVEFSK